MFLKTISAAALAIAASGLVSAQTATKCNPLYTACSGDLAFGNERVDCDFASGACNAFEVLAGTTLSYSSMGAAFSIQNQYNAPTVATTQFIFFGRIDITLQAAPGKGIVTSVVLQSDCLDEIDLEWVGGDNAQVQSNYFSKGNITTYDRGAFHPVANPTGSFHTYTIEWTSKITTWSIDGKVVRTLTPEQANGGATYPQTPMQIKAGTWVGGRSDAAAGTIQWAGGYADFSTAPFNAYYKSISIVDYAGTDGPCSSGVKQYVYGDHSGTSQSIQSH